MVICPAQTPASVGLGQRGTAFSHTLEVLDRLREGGPVVLVARSQGQVGRLLALFGEHDRPAVEWKPSALSSGGAQKAPFSVLNGEVSAGFLSPDLRLVVLTEEELFAKGARHKPQTKSKAATFLSSLEDLNAGDYVVHMQYGIAKYQGLRRLSVQDFDSDFLVLEFAGTDKLYVPLDRLSQVQRYAGADAHVPRLDRLGGTSWAKTTARVKKDIEEMAHELVDLYANRELVHRTSYGKDSMLYHEFEAAFEYEETPDQRKAIEDIANDMASTKPMDASSAATWGTARRSGHAAAFKAVEKTGRWQSWCRPRYWPISIMTISPNGLRLFPPVSHSCRDFNLPRIRKRYQGSAAGVVDVYRYPPPAAEGRAVPQLGPRHH